MNIEVTGRNIEITAALRGYIDDKCERLERHFGHLISAHFVLGLDKQVHAVEATIGVGGRTNPIVAEAEAADMYAAIDELIDKLDRQVRRHKGKVTNHHRSAQTG